MSKSVEATLSDPVCHWTSWSWPSPARELVCCWDRKLQLGVWTPLQSRVVRFDFDTLGACLGCFYSSIECAGWHKLSFKLHWRRVGRLHDYVPFYIIAPPHKLLFLESFFSDIFLLRRCLLFFSFWLRAGPSWLCKSAKTRRNTSYLAGPIDRCHLEWFTVNWGCCLQWISIYPGPASTPAQLRRRFMFIFIYGTFRLSSGIFSITHRLCRKLLRVRVEARACRKVRVPRKLINIKCLTPN